MCSLKQFLDQQFKIKDFDHLHYFLGNKVIQEAGYITLTQKKFTLDLLDEFHCDSLTHVSSHLVASLKHNHDIGDILLDPPSYSHLVGKLNYLTNTKTDLGYLVQPSS